MLNKTCPFSNYSKPLWGFRAQAYTQIGFVFNTQLIAVENILPHTWNTWEYLFHFVTLYLVLNKAKIIESNQSKEGAKFHLSVKNLRRPIIKIQAIVDMFNSRNEVVISVSTVCSFSRRKTNRSSLQKSISHYTVLDLSDGKIFTTMEWLMVFFTVPL